MHRGLLDRFSVSTLFVVVSFFFIVLLPVRAHAACTTTGATTTCTYSGADQTYTVPAGVNQLSVQLYGAGGQKGTGTGGGTGGVGGYSSGNVLVTPGQVLTVKVGQPRNVARTSYNNGLTSLLSGTTTIFSGAAGGAGGNDLGGSTGGTGGLAGSGSILGTGGSGGNGGDASFGGIGGLGGPGGVAGNGYGCVASDGNAGNAGTFGGIGGGGGGGGNCGTGSGGGGSAAGVAGQAIITAVTTPACTIPGTFNYTGNFALCYVPATSSYKVETWGAQGGAGGSGIAGGLGGYAMGQYTLTAGTVITLFVGGTGSGTANGIGYWDSVANNFLAWGGYGAIGSGGATSYGGGGGGASVATIDGTHYVMAGGGGGGGGCAAGAVGNVGGGSSTGGNGVAGSPGAPFAYGGTGGNATPGTTGANGTGVFGGYGGDMWGGGSGGRASTGCGGGGGGGGGTFAAGGGGGGAAGGGSGGGGDSAAAGGSSSSILSGQRTGNGQIIISYGYQPPTAPTSMTGPATGSPNTAYTYTVGGGTDPQSYGIRYGIDCNNDGVVDVYAPATGTVASGGSSSNTCSFPAAGSYILHARTETPTTGFTSGWYTGPTVVISNTPTALISASTNTFRGGDPAITLTWSSSYTTSCTGTNFSTGNATGGTAVVTPSATTTYTVTCTGGSASSNTTVNYTPNLAPAAPAITGPTTAMQGTANNTYTFLAADPESDTIVYGIDWNHDGTVDEWIPGAATYQASNTTGQTTHTWATSGTTTFQALTQDSRGASSGWTQYTVVVLQSCGATGTYPITGYAWTDTVGWIDLNCANTNSCAASNFGLTVDSAGAISGCAWSPNVGWISASSVDLTGCPSGTCSAMINSNGLVTGWLKAIAVGNLNWWDGWIALNGTWTSSVTLSAGVFSGYGWAGNDLLQWVDFSRARTTYVPCVSSGVCSGNSVVDSCTGAVITPSCTYGCYNGGCNPTPSPSFNAGTSTSGGALTGHLQLKPSLVRSGYPTWVYWNLSNATSCSITGTNGNSWTGLASGVGGATSSAITGQVTFTLACQALAGATSTGVSEKQTVNVTPKFRER